MALKPTRGLYGRLGGIAGSTTRTFDARIADAMLDSFTRCSIASYSCRLVSTSRFRML